MKIHTVNVTPTNTQLVVGNVYQDNAGRFFICASYKNDKNHLYMINLKDGEMDNCLSHDSYRDITHQVSLQPIKKDV